jgi:hypothetical protein
LKSGEALCGDTRKITATAALRRRRCAQANFARRRGVVVKKRGSFVRLLSLSSQPLE